MSAFPFKAKCKTKDPATETFTDEKVVVIAVDPIDYGGRACLLVVTKEGNIKSVPIRMIHSVVQSGKLYIG